MSCTALFISTCPTAAVWVFCWGMAAVMEVYVRVRAAGQCDIGRKDLFFLLFSPKCRRQLVECVEMLSSLAEIAPSALLKASLWYHLHETSLMQHNINFILFPPVCPETVQWLWVSWQRPCHTQYSMLTDILDVFMWPCAPCCCRKKNLGYTVFLQPPFWCNRLLRQQRCNAAASEDCLARSRQRLLKLEEWWWIKTLASCMAETHHIFTLKFTFSWGYHCQVIYHSVSSEVMWIRPFLCGTKWK